MMAEFRTAHAWLTAKMGGRAGMPRLARLAIPLASPPGVDGQDFISICRQPHTPALQEDDAPAKFMPCGG